MRLKQISKRSLAIILSVLMVFSTLMVGSITTANAAISAWYVAGSFTSWADGKVKLTNNTVTLDLSDYVGTQISFKMIAEENGDTIWNGASNTAITAGTQKELSWGGGNDMTFTPSKPMVTFKITVSNGKNYVTVTQADKPVTKHSVTVTAGTGGTATTSASEVEVGKTYTITVTPNTNYEVDTFTVSNDSNATLNSSNKYTGTMGTSNITVNVTFKLKKYTVTSGTSTGGKVYINTTDTTSATVNAGTSVTLLNVPDDGYTFSKYTVDGTQVTSPYTPTKNGVTVVGVFTKNQYTLTDSTADKTQGTVEMKVNGTVSNKFSIGDTVVFTAKPAAGYSVNTLTVDGATVTSPYTLTVTKDNLKNISASATFTANTYNVNVENVAGATVTVDKATAKANETVTVTVSTATGYICNNITVDDKSYTVTNGKATFPMPAKDVTIKANVTVKITAPIITINADTTHEGVGSGYKALITPVVNIADDEETYVTIDSKSFTNIPANAKIVEETVNGVKQYYFYATAEGEYTLTYTAVIKSTLDNTTTATGTNTVTIKVTYSNIQKAYNNLKTTVDACDDVNSDNYDTSSDEWKAYENALNVANGLLEESMPTAPSEEDVSKTATYNNNATALQTAYNNLAKCEKDKTVYLGIVTHLPKENYSKYKIVFLGSDNGYLGEKSVTDLNIVRSYSVGKDFWSNAPQEFNMFCVSGDDVPANAAKAYVKYDTNSVGQNIDISTYNTLLAFEYGAPDSEKGKPNHIVAASGVYTRYTITTYNEANGTITSDKTSAIQGETVTITATPIDKTVILQDVIVKTSSGATVSATVDDNKATFVMPSGDVTVTPVFDENITIPYTYRQHNKSDQTYTEHSMKYARDELGQLFYYYEYPNSGDCLFTIVNDTTNTEYTWSSYSSYYYQPSNEYLEFRNWGVKGTDYPKTYYGDGSYYIIVYPSGYKLNGTEIAHDYVCAKADLPGDKSLRITIHDGQSDRLLGVRGTSYLDGVVGNKTVKYNVDEFSGTVTFTTDTVELLNTENVYKFKGFYQQVYGYHIVMETEETDSDGKMVRKKSVASVFGDQISSPKKGTYTSSYTFPKNLITADITPIFISSDEYLAKSGISATTVYLKLTPGSNILANTWEPSFYTWRVNGIGHAAQMVDVTLPNGTTANLNGDPDGDYPGQKLLYTGNGMYMAKVETGILGITFTDGADGDPQTFDYTEFIKLQQLGYNDITFEPKQSNNETSASQCNTEYQASGNKTYKNDPNPPKGFITTDSTKKEFYLDTNIEGYYIDVFGNYLLDKQNNRISKDSVIKAVVADNAEPFNTATTEADVNTSLEMKKLLQVMGKDFNKPDECTSLYGARYGWYTQTDFYGMEFAIRVYYFNNQNKMVSQQISGYGTIEGAISPKDSTLTNAQYVAAGKLPGVKLQAKQISDTDSITTLTTGDELIPFKYRGVPYLVSYKIATSDELTSGATTSDFTRVDGKWYYQPKKAQMVVNMKTGLMVDGAIKMSNGVIVDQGTTYGTAFINGATSITVDQGTQAAINANPIQGYRFVGFYDKNGNLISNTNPDVYNVTLNAEIYAVFEKLGDGILQITNNLYIGSNPPAGNGAGAGKGTVGVELTIFDAQGNAIETVKGTNSVSHPIEDGQGYQWKITGKPLGVDEFVAFRHPEEQADGSYYYSKLDVEEQLSVAADGTWSYTSEKIKNFNWRNDYPGVNSVSFDFVTDFKKISVKATLNYVYRNRFNELRTYSVKDVLLSDEEIGDGKFIPSNETIKKYAPPIDEVFTNCYWDITNSELLETGKSVATLTARQEKKKFKTYIFDKAVNDAVAVPKVEFYDTVLELKAEGKGFKYWKQYEIDSTGQKVGDGVIFSYDPHVAIRVSFNRYYEAVYDDVEVQDVVTSVQDPIYTREKYTAEDGTVKDYIYVDFLLQFETCLADSFKDYVKRSTADVKFGIILERDTTKQYTAEDLKNGTALSEKAPTYVGRTYDLVDDVILDLGNNIAPGASKGGWTMAPEGHKEYDYYYNLFDLTNYADSLTSLGRIDYFLMFDNNVEVNRNHVYNVYSYVIYDTTIINDNGESEKVTKVVISTPKVMNIREIGDRTDGTN